MVEIRCPSCNALLGKCNGDFELACRKHSPTRLVKGKVVDFDGKHVILFMDNFILTVVAGGTRSLLAFGA